MTLNNADHCADVPQRQCPLSAGGLVQIRELIVEPITAQIVDRIGEMEARLAHRIVEQEARLTAMEQRQDRADDATARNSLRLDVLEGWVKRAAAWTAGALLVIQFAWNAWGDWFRKKLGI